MPPKDLNSCTLQEKESSLPCLSRLGVIRDTIAVCSFAIPPLFKENLALPNRVTGVAMVMEFNIELDE